MNVWETIVIHEGKLNDPYACDGDYYAVAYILTVLCTRSALYTFTYVPAIYVYVY